MAENDDDRNGGRVASVSLTWEDLYRSMESGESWEVRSRSVERYLATGECL